MSKAIQSSNAIDFSREPRAPSHATQTMSAAPIENSWAVIRIELQMKGKIAMDPSGQKFLEAELNQPRWSQANACATLLARMIESVFSLEAEALQLRLRIVAHEHHQVQPEIHLVSTGLVCPDSAKLKAVVACFGSRMTPQRHMLDTPASTQLSQELEQKISDGVGIFLQGNGGQAVQRALQIMVEDEAISSMRGRWCQGLAEEKEAAQQLELEALFDGRRLRARILYVNVVAERMKGLEIFYDEELFDASLRALEDNKMAMLSLVVVQTHRGGKERACYELLSLERIPTPEHLELTAPTSPVG